MSGQIITARAALALFDSMLEAHEAKRLREAFEHGTIVRGYLEAMAEFEKGQREALCAGILNAIQEMGQESKIAGVVVISKLRRNIKDAVGLDGGVIDQLLLELSADGRVELLPGMADEKQRGLFVIDVGWLNLVKLPGVARMELVQGGRG